MTITIMSFGEVMRESFPPEVPVVRRQEPWSHLLHHRKRRVRKKAPAVMARKRRASLLDVVRKSTSFGEPR